MTSEVEERVVRVVRDIAATPGRIFELIADPRLQPVWDGNDNLARAESGQRVRALGEVFVMALTRGGIRENRVVEFEEGRLIAWNPSEPGSTAPGHLWRWELEPLDDANTQVTHTYDWSQLTDERRFERARANTEEALASSLRRLAVAAEAPNRS
ncbi:SRPBCC family protein [Kineosporia sp. NBRC 101731]|uniref:SRPBCC family protein n=1 Tax=Kineosporia sp. NBRC 101731 TaxID=3032199 RepID=UPI0025564B09|nr:SRPBCC family protein [Kineosporia sp. NBRC 101731]